MTHKSKAEERRYGHRKGNLLNPVACGLERDVQIMAARQQVVGAAMAWYATPLGWGGDDGMQRDALGELQAACATLAKLEGDK